MQDLFTSLLKDVCHDAEVEPHLQPLTGEVLISSANSSDEAHLDVVARGSWQRRQCAFFDATVFNPFAKRVALTKNLTRLSRAMRTRKTTTSELLKLIISCSHHMVEMVEKACDFLPN